METRKVEQYRIEIDESTGALTGKVNEMVTGGWVPTGGVAVVTAGERKGNTVFFFAQALVMYKR